MFLGIGNIVRAGVHHHQHHICRCYAPSDQRALVGALGDICGLVVGRKSALGPALAKIAPQSDFVQPNLVLPATTGEAGRYVSR